MTIAIPSSAAAVMTDVPVKVGKHVVVRRSLGMLEVQRRVNLWPAVFIATPVFAASLVGIALCAAVGSWCSVSALVNVAAFLASLWLAVGLLRRPRLLCDGQTLVIPGCPPVALSNVQSVLVRNGQGGVPELCIALHSGGTTDGFSVGEDAGLVLQAMNDHVFNRQPQSPVATNDVAPHPTAPTAA
jgi:hypothetical protein